MANHTDQAAGLRKSVSRKQTLQSKKALCCLAVASGKGGVGKTFISVNLAVAFSRMKKKVLLVDADLGLANADIIFGVHPEFTLQDAIFKGKDLADIVTHTDYGVDLLSASSGSKEILAMGQARMELFIKDLLTFAATYDVLIFDCAAGIDSSVTSFIAATPRSVIVATSQPTSLMDVYALTKLVYQDQLSEQLSFIVNMVDSDAQGEKVMNALNQVTKQYLNRDMDLLGIIPDSDQVRKAVHLRKPVLAVSEDDIASKRIREIAMQIIKSQDAKSGIEGLDAKRLLDGFINM